MPDVQLLQGDCREQLATLPAASVQTCITSPPYFGLRDYGHTGQIGLEASVDAYVAALVAVFRAVRRVLRPDGTLWLNLGDSYSGSSMGGGTGRHSTLGGTHHSDRTGTQPLNKPVYPVSEKQLLGMPWRVAFALQADGWVLRSDIIWSKPNAMPESVTDRPTKAHEYLFLLAPGPRYYYDADAVRETYVKPLDNTHRSSYQGPPSGYDIATGVRPVKGDAGLPLHPAGRNKRTVWTIATRPFKSAHFATFPPDLIRPCVLAGTSAAGQCAVCGRPWARVTERGETPPSSRMRSRGAIIAQKDTESGQRRGSTSVVASGRIAVSTTVGWQPTCTCNGHFERRVRGAGWTRREVQIYIPHIPLDDHPTAPQTVLDPFNGAGTTGVVALAAGRAYIGCELNADYLTLTRDRLATVQAPLVQEMAS